MSGSVRGSGNVRGSVRGVELNFTAWPKTKLWRSGVELRVRVSVSLSGVECSSGVTCHVNAPFIAPGDRPLTPCLQGLSC